jgi:cell wall-associated NlpC family hydrolase
VQLYAKRQKVRHTVEMRRGVWLLVLGVVAAALGVVAAAFDVGSARADGAGTTTTATSTTDTTTTATATSSYAPLASSYLPAGCVGAGAGALVLPAHPVIALGTPASTLGPSAYSSSSGPILAFDSSTSSGATCSAEYVKLSAVSLFGDAVSATSVQARDGKGSATGLEIDGAAVTATAGQTVPVEGWGQLTLGSTVGRVTAPLVLRLLQAHDSIPAGTAVVVGFAASAQPVARPKPTQNRQAPTRQKDATAASHARKQSKAAHHSRKHVRAPRKRPPGFPASSYPFLADGGLTPEAQANGVVSIAMRYLGIPYKWAGASPKTGFDCSGLVKYVFAQLGVSLPHFAAAQYRSPGSVWIPPDRLQPGDLVFFTGSDGTRKAPGHVGIYVDDGYIIDAPHTGAVVRIDSLSEPSVADEYVGAKRIVGASVDARRLLRVTRPKASAAAVPLGLASPFSIGPVGDSVGVAVADVATVPAGTHTSALRNWTGVGLGSVLLLLVVPGAFTYRRRRRPPEASPSTPDDVEHVS